MFDYERDPCPLCGPLSTIALLESHRWRCPTPAPFDPTRHRGVTARAGRCQFCQLSARWSIARRRSLRWVLHAVCDRHADKTGPGTRPFARAVRHADLTVTIRLDEYASELFLQALDQVQGTDPSTLELIEDICHQLRTPTTQHT